MGLRTTTKAEKCLENLKIKTIADLEASRFWVIEPEETWAKKVGIDLIRYPLYAMPFFLGDIQTEITDDNLNHLDDAHMDPILAKIADPDSRPIYVHCMKGDDRTGLVIGLYRVFYEKMNKEAAWAEMCKFGLHPFFTAIVDYLKRGPVGPPTCPNISYNPFK